MLIEEGSSHTAQLGRCNRTPELSLLQLLPSAWQFGEEDLEGLEGQRGALRRQPDYSTKQSPATAHCLPFRAPGLEKLAAC